MFVCYWSVLASASRTDDSLCTGSGHGRPGCRHQDIAAAATVPARPPHHHLHCLIPSHRLSSASSTHPPSLTSPIYISKRILLAMIMYLHELECFFNTLEDIILPQKSLFKRCSFCSVSILHCLICDIWRATSDPRLSIVPWGP